MNRTKRWVSVMAMGSSALLFGAWHGYAQSGGGGDFFGDPPLQKSLVLGQSLPGLDGNQKANFEAGLQKFSTVELPEEGLGPVFNGTSCAECHKAGAIGGANLDVTIGRVRRIGGIVNGQYSDLTEVGGPVLQARSVREFDLAYPFGGEVVPREAQFVSHRITTPLFGAGLIEAIPDAVILERTRQRDPDGVHGVANMVMNPETLQSELGRFGWKAQVSRLHVFAGDAYLNEMGIPSSIFPHKNLPQGRPILPGWDIQGDRDESDGDVTAFTNFMRMLAPPEPRLPISPQARLGVRLFAAIRCTACHTPLMMTGASDIAALANKPVRLFSDLLLHDMGPQLADGIQQGMAKGNQFRTAPLWGLSRRAFYLHDGRATNLQDAVFAHGGEATPARQRFQSLRPEDRENLLTFLNSL